MITIGKVADRHIHEQYDCNAKREIISSKDGECQASRFAFDPQFVHLAAIQNRIHPKWAALVPAEFGPSDSLRTVPVPRARRTIAISPVNGELEIHHFLRNFMHPEQNTTMKFLPMLKAINWSKYAEIAISGLIILLFALPHYVSYDPSLYDWENVFLIEDEFFIILYFPFVLLWIAYIRWKATTYGKGLPLLLFCYGIGLCGLNFLTASFMFMDVAPSIGMGIPFLIFGCLVVLCWPYLPKPPQIEQEEEDEDLE